MPGPSANQALWDKRHEIIKEQGKVISYEIVLKEEDAWSELSDILPKLARYLDSKKESFPPGPCVLLGVWSHDEIHLFQGPTFWEAILALAPTEQALEDSLGRRPVAMLPLPSSTDQS